MPFVSNLGIAFQEVVRMHEDRTALLYNSGGGRVSYKALAALSNAVARALIARDVPRGSVIAIFHDKSALAFATMLACLQAGVTYTILDPDSPWARLEKILSTCQPDLIISGFAQMPFEAQLREGGYSRFMRLQTEVNAPHYNEIPLSKEVVGSTPAYIMFTSGSTGNPKGAVMSHANLLWFIQWAQDRFNITPDDVLTNVNPIYFDNSVFDFYSAIFTGATLVPLTSEEVRSPRTLVHRINSAACTVWFSVPSLLVYLLTTRAISSSDFPKIRKIIFGGEGFPKVKLKQLYDLFAGRSELENVYGPTECTCICSAHTITPSDFDDMKNLATLGPLSQNFDFEILPQDASNPLFGELFLRGPHVGLGYFNDPERTSKAFVQNPNHNRYTDIGYKTGDLVQVDASGNLHFRGRIDFQIKHMGYRIELEEIEAALGTIPYVRECAVIYHRTPDGFGQILAYVAAGAQVNQNEIIESVSKIVPAYMVPRSVQILQSLPKNANGKIDRVALKTLVEQPGQV
jgi:D-alanine--poly(phosphoribitol) ligase subunit 1